MSTAFSDFKCDLGRYMAPENYDDFERVSAELWRSGIQGKLKIAAKSFRTHGIWALAEYRFGRFVRERRIRPLMPVSVLWHVAVESLTGISISHRATIGKGFYIGHLSGIVVGSGVVIGRWCNISQGVTVGAATGRGPSGSPVVGDRVYIAPGAKVFGPISVGDGATIGANAVVNRDVPDRAVAVGVPAKVVRIDPDPNDPTAA